MTTDLISRKALLEEMRTLNHFAVDDYIVETINSAPALSQPIDPVAWLCLDVNGDKILSFGEPMSYYEERPLYTSAPPNLEAKVKELEELLSFGGTIHEVQQHEIAKLTVKSEQMQSLCKSICIYSREMLGHIAWQSDEHAVNYMLSFTEENPHGDESIATVKG